MPTNSPEMKTSPKMKYPQFINGHCVVCFEEEETCRADFEKFGPNRKNFMTFPIVPLKIWDLQMKKARFSVVYNWEVPEHHWFHLFSTIGWSDFSIEQEYWNRATIEEETYYKEMLLQKWTSTSHLLIENIIDFEIYRHARNLWGVSPIDQYEWELATLKERKRMDAYKTNFADDDTTEASSESSDSDATVALQQLTDVAEKTSDSEYMKTPNGQSPPRTLSVLKKTLFQIQRQVGAPSRLMIQKNQKSRDHHPLNGMFQLGFWNLASTPIPTNRRVGEASHQQRSIN